MQVCGVICEYNPFHKGHALHLEKARALSGADYIVCVMSGPVTQRGVFARHDKWTRAKMALHHGAALVLELPVRFACAPAPDFASGGVNLLDALGVTTHLSFGCEAESLPLLSEAARVLARETPAFSAALSAALSAGMSYPRARALAAQQSSGTAGLDEAISRPNAALALEYLQALPTHMQAVPVVREGSGYHDRLLTPLASATAVRAALQAGDLSAALQAVPSPDLLEQAENSGDIHTESALDQALLYRLRTTPPQELAGIYGMDEGLEYRFAEAARKASSREALLALIKSKRYTHARLSRICANALMGVTTAFADANRTPTYARILGFRRDAQPLLHEIKRSSAIPLVSKAADYDPQDPLFTLDVRAQDLWSLGVSNPALRMSGRDFTTSPVIVR